MSAAESESTRVVPVELDIKVERDGEIVPRTEHVDVPDPHRAGEDNLVAIGFKMLRDGEYPNARFGTGRVIDR